MDRIGRKKIRFQAIVQKKFWNIVENKRKEACQKIVDNFKKKCLIKVPIVTKDQTWCFA